MSQHSGSLPKAFRFAAPRTPEPSDGSEEMQFPSPPRPRLKLKRRNVSHQHQRTAPTEQFLASVAAADLPIPSIEEPTLPSSGAPEIMSSFPTFSLPDSTANEQDTHLLVPRGRAFSPPKTPAPGFVPSLSPPRYPDWTLDSASSSVESTPDPDYESSRPSTSRSTQTSTSLFSGLSQMSDEDHCVSPPLHKDDSKFVLLDEVIASNANASLRHKSKARKAPWTKAMSAHLWSTFVLYLEDPKVTPFRTERNGIPPTGVCLRVAREAKRSWKGSKALQKGAKPNDGKKSGSSTPTAEDAGTYMEWPHTCAATRAHLRELCKLKAASGGGRNMHLLSRSSTPFSQAASRHWNRRSTPGHSSAVFATKDISLSLAVSTSDSMHPDGPLAQLTGSVTADMDPVPVATPSTPPPTLGPAFQAEPSFAERRRLGSPFSTRTYGPSSSKALAVALDFSSIPSRLTGPQRVLQSPVHLSRSGTHKRRNTQSGVPRKRPSLVSDIWVDPNSTIAHLANRTSGAEPSVIVSSGLSDPFGPQPEACTDVATHRQLERSMAPPSRLGSPFLAAGAGTNSSLSFPRRTHRPAESVDLGMLGRPFATLQFHHMTEGSTDFRSTHAIDRFSWIDQRLRELRNRDARRRSGSPL